MSIDLMKDEQIAYEGKQHWIVFLLPALVLAIAAGMMTGPRGIAWPFIIALAWMFLRVMEFRSAQFLVTNKRVIIKTGWSSKNVFEMLLHKVETVNVSQSMTAFGALTIKGSGGAAASVKYLRRPMELKNAIQEHAAK